MLTKFWENMDEGLSGKWLDQLLTPAFIFWGGGLLIFVLRNGIGAVWLQIRELSIETQFGAIIIGLLILLFSNELMEKLDYAALRLLEGYWFKPFQLISRLLIAFHQRRAERLHTEWNGLKAKEDHGILSAEEQKRISDLETQLHYYPADPNDFLPTYLGNALRAGESAVYYKYGLDAVVCWSRLWLLVPSSIQEELNKSRKKLDQLIQLVAWGFLFVIWTWWWPWAVVISLAWIFLSYDFAVQSARVYADLLKSVFDLYRFDLYKAAGWTLPSQSGDTEVVKGKQLTEYLWRGTTEKPLKFDHRR